MTLGVGGRGEGSGERADVTFLRACVRRARAKRVRPLRALSFAACGEDAAWAVGCGPSAAGGSVVAAGGRRRGGVRVAHPTPTATDQRRAVIFGHRVAHPEGAPRGLACTGDMWAAVIAGFPGDFPSCSAARRSAARRSAAGSGERRAARAGGGAQPPAPRRNTDVGVGHGSGVAPASPPRHTSCQRCPASVGFNATALHFSACNGARRD